MLAILLLAAFFHFRHTTQPSQGIVPDTTDASKTPHPATPLDPGGKDEEKLAAEALAKEAAARKPAESHTNGKDSGHPIDTLIGRAEKEFEAILEKETHDLKSAAKAYRERRGRHPPPGFDEWFKFAQDNKAVMVEDFFDQIYHDLNPFWALPPAVMRREGWDHEITINIRDHNATAGSTWFWTQIWLNLAQSIQHLLPDMDLPLNAMDEPRIVTPWEKINEYVEIERKERSMPPPGEVVSEFQKLTPPKELEKDLKIPNKEWENTRKNLISAYRNATNRIRTLLEACCKRLPPR